MPVLHGAPALRLRAPGASTPGIDACRVLRPDRERTIALAEHNVRPSGTQCHPANTYSNSALQTDDSRPMPMTRRTTWHGYCVSRSQSTTGITCDGSLILTKIFVFEYLT